MAKVVHRTYRLEAGLQEQLEAALATALEVHVNEWKDHVKTGLIGEEERAVFSAIGWLSSRSDSRLTAVDEQTNG